MCWWQACRKCSPGAIIFPLSFSDGASEPPGTPLPAPHTHPVRRPRPTRTSRSGCVRPSVCFDLPSQPAARFTGGVPLTPLERGERLLGMAKLTGPRPLGSGRASPPGGNSRGVEVADPMAPISRQWFCLALGVDRENGNVIPLAPQSRERLVKEWGRCRRGPEFLSSFC